MEGAAANTPKTPRRTFLKLGLAGLLAVLFAGVGNAVIRYLMPRERRPTGPKPSIPVSRIAEGSSLVVDYQGSPVILVHSAGRVLAFSAVCTHLGCLVKWVDDKKEFLCPCHNGRFDKNGKVLGGPPPEPLPSIPIRIQNDNVFLG
ncbi:MAG: ubiquinol-cytochrome c reductase iron-sulfur subunit [Nitrospinaceae bacterium]